MTSPRSTAVRRPHLPLLACCLAVLALAGCGGSTAPKTTSVHDPRARSAHRGLFAAIHNVYAHDYASDLSPVVAHDRPLIYVPNSGSNTVTEIDPADVRMGMRVQAVWKPKEEWGLGIDNID